MVLSGTVLTSTALAHFLTTGCALMLIRRGPNRRLRLLTVTVGLMSLSQTIMLLQSGGLWQTSSMFFTGSHQVLIGALSLLAIHLLGREIWDRNHTDRRLRLVEHETARAVAASHPAIKAEYQPANPLALIPRSIAEPWRTPSPVRVNSAESTEDLLFLLEAIEAHAHGSVRIAEQARSTSRTTLRA
jgi:hypothetical protein